MTVEPPIVSWNVNTWANTATVTYVGSWQVPSHHARASDGVQDILARNLFATDPRVQAFVALRSEGRTSEQDRVIKVAWARNENGWRTECEDRAAQMALKMRP